MRFIDQDEPSAPVPFPVIGELTHRVDDDRCTLRWRWPEGIQAVYIYKSPAGSGGADYQTSVPPAGELRLYTRDEYKANNGYHDRIQEIGQLVYTVYASWSEQGDTLLARQHDGANRTVASTGKAKIYYSVREKSGLFSKYKTVQITVTAEVPVAKDVLCYVKKQGGYPADREDGTVYPFVTPFAAGRNVLPVIEVGKQDHVRLFFTDGPKYGHMYVLIPE
ncbi:beta-mannanase [Paenibacillus tuaregi]|uniref:beta-mannanase n=1 Tax=Paenibacillus tuaregi TaxID=1816681 RepID=UPI000838255D|nr:beta-mannanase [Paenibacillus tuaregi]